MGFKKYKYSYFVPQKQNIQKLKESQMCANESMHFYFKESLHKVYYNHYFILYYILYYNHYFNHYFTSLHPAIRYTAVQI